MYKHLLIVITGITTGIALAETSITLDQQQLGTAQQQIQQSGKAAIAKMGQASQTLGNIKLKQLDLTRVESEYWRV